MREIGGRSIVYLGPYILPNGKRRKKADRGVGFWQGHVAARNRGSDLLTLHGRI